MQATFPWPPSSLSPNTRQHWSKLAKAKKQYREACAWTAKQQGAKPIKAEKLHVSVTFYPPDRRKRDLDNMVSSCKALFDGLADVIGVDDSKWTLTIKKAEEIGGMVKVTIDSA